MDEIDAKILQHLERDGKITHQDLSDKVGLSLSACQRRVKQLEKSGVIAGYRAVIAPAFRGEQLVIIVGVNLEKHDRTIIQNFHRDILKLAKIQEVHHIAGDYDYILKVAVANMAAYEDFLADQLAAVPGIAKISSYISMSQLK